MMKAGNRMVTTCRKPDGSLVVNDDSFVSAKDKNKLYGLPLVRGVVSFVESLLMSFKTLGASADALGLDEPEEEPSKFEKWLSKKLKIKLTDAVMVVSLLLGLALSALLFVFLPIWITAGINLLLGLLFSVSMPAWLSAILEGLVKMAIFVGYLAAVSFMPDIKRTFMYHGAEHKSIACFEAGEQLTPENARNYTRFHPRCGTSFMFFMILLGIFAGFVLKTVIPDSWPEWLYPIFRIAVLPILMGLGYEFIRFAGKHPSALTRALSAPGLWMQRITTKEPTDDMLECAIISLKCALRDDYPEFAEFYEAKPWEPEKMQNAECRMQNEESALPVECAEQSEENENAECRMQNAEGENSLPLEGKVLNESEADEVEIPENNDDNTSSVTEGDSFPSRGSLGESEENEI